MFTMMPIKAMAAGSIAVAFALVLISCKSTDRANSNRAESETQGFDSVAGIGDEDEAGVREVRCADGTTRRMTSKQFSQGMEDGSLCELPQVADGSPERIKKGNELAGKASALGAPIGGVNGSVRCEKKGVAGVWSSGVLTFGNGKVHDKYARGYCNEIVDTAKGGTVCDYRTDRVYRSSDGTLLSDTRQRNCSDLSGGARNGLVCLRAEDGFGPVRVRDLWNFPATMSRSTCIDMVAASENDLVCVSEKGTYRIARISTAEYLTEAFSGNNDLCAAITKNSTSTAFCKKARVSSPNGDERTVFQIWNWKKGMPIGNPFPRFADCTRGLGR